MSDKQSVQREKLEMGLALGPAPFFSGETECRQELMSLDSIPPGASRTSEEVTHGNES